jgi:hypothetical protein
MKQRESVPKSIVDMVLVASARRCCLCVFLLNRDEVRKGQIAHLNRKPSDNRFENLVWLCFDHHDEYDSGTSQSKGLTHGEVKHYRERLYGRKDLDRERDEVKSLPESRRVESLTEHEKLRAKFHDELGFVYQPWRFALWLTANKPEFFAYKAGNCSDGVCLIERIDLPDGRIVIALIQTAGNPGNSITNCAEELCFQIWERFELEADRLVWLEHYDYYTDDWDMLTFGQIPPAGPFAEPRWEPMTPHLWQTLRLKPKKRLSQRHSEYNSKITKLFHWPTEALL